MKRCNVQEFLINSHLHCFDCIRLEKQGIIDQCDNCKSWSKIKSSKDVYKVASELFNKDESK